MLHSPERRKKRKSKERKAHYRALPFLPSPSVIAMFLLNLEMKDVGPYTLQV